MTTKTTDTRPLMQLGIDALFAAATTAVKAGDKKAGAEIAGECAHRKNRAKALGLQLRAWVETGSKPDLEFAGKPARERWAIRDAAKKAAAKKAPKAGAKKAPAKSKASEPEDVVSFAFLKAFAGMTKAEQAKALAKLAG